MFSFSKKRFCSAGNLVRVFFFLIHFRFLVRVSKQVKCEYFRADKTIMENDGDFLNEKHMTIYVGREKGLDEGHE